MRMSYDVRQPPLRHPAADTNLSTFSSVII